MADTHYQANMLSRPNEIGEAKRYAYRIVSAYFAIFYLFPFFNFMAFGNPLEEFLAPRPNYILGLSYVGFAYGLFVLSLRLPTVRPPRMMVGLARLAFDSRLSVGYAIFFLLYAIATRNVLGSQFRHTGDAMAEVGAIAFVMQFLKLYFGVAILVHYRMLQEDRQRRGRSIALLFTGLGFLISIQAAYDVIFGIAGLLALGLNWRRLVGLHFKAVQWLSFLLLPAVVVLAGFAGIANKVGYEEALRLSFGSDYIIRAILSRIGYALYSTSMYVSNHFLNFGLFLDAIQNIMGTFIYRCSVLLGIDGVTKPEVVSIARMNFLEITERWSARTGASPSMFGAVFYMPGAGLAILYYVFILRGITMMIGRIMAPMSRNLFFLIVSVIVFSSVVDSLLDALNPLSTGFIRLLFIYLGLMYVTYIIDFTVERGTIRQ